MSKKNQNFTNFFSREIEYKTRSGTQFHQKRQCRTDFGLTTARHEKITSPESGPNSRQKLLMSMHTVSDHNLITYYIVTKKGRDPGLSILFTAF